MAEFTIRRQSGDVHTVKYDAADFALIEPFAWCLTAGYAYNRSAGYLHRHLMGLRPGDKRQVDHINGDRLDNRRVNLRVVTEQENKRGYRTARASSGHRGVVWDKRNQRWRVQVQRNKRAYHGGRYDDLADAVRAAEELRRRVLGDQVA
jgi:hypothetical protein